MLAEAQPVKRPSEVLANARSVEAAPEYADMPLMLERSTFYPEQCADMARSLLLCVA